jgi:hypothetical protein
MKDSANYPTQKQLRKKGGGFMRSEQKRALFVLGDSIELYPPDSASGPDLELRGIRSKIKAIQFGPDPEAQMRRIDPAGHLGSSLREDLWLYRLELEGQLGKRHFREDWIRPSK